ncbi:MAG: T9SS type A sorting domain-containing protein [Tannerella sp.]|jgi:hypothetical protein|nr:T9SS type A sorting domain-containing protein [Tannerella sp.]
MKTKCIGMIFAMVVTLSGNCIPKSASSVPESTGEEVASDSPAINYLLKEIREENKVRVVYRDFGDGSTLYTQRAVHNPKGVHPVMNEAAPSPYGVTCIHVTWPLNVLDWNGFMFITGRLPGDSIIPELDFGQNNTGFDLQGAVKLTFKARGKTGRERIKFYMGGLGGTTERYHDSDQIFLTGGDGFITLSSEWKEYSIDLRRADLSRIGCGFAWVTSQTENTGLQTLEFDLDDIFYHFDTERHDPLFLRSYGILPVSDERSFTNNFAYTYDNALLAITMVKSGHLAYARQIADALAYCVVHDRYYEPGPLRNAYANGSPVSFPGWHSPRGGEFAMLPGFYNTEAAVWYEDRYAVSINAGVMAWAIEALLTVYDETETPEYLSAAVSMADYILKNYSTNDPLGGFTGGEEGWEGQTEKLTYKSTEHNIDLISAFMHLYQIWKETKPQDAEKYLAAAREARDFVLAMYEDGCLYTGTSTDGITLNRDNKPLDTNTWAILTLTGDREADGRWDPEDVYAFIERTFKVGEGVDYNQDLDGCWNEGTAQLAVAAAVLGKTAEYERLMRYLNDAAEDDGSICSASIDGLTTGFESMIATEDGGIKAIPWVYDHRISLASTAWLAFAQLNANPYFVSNETVALNSKVLKLYPNPAGSECTLVGLGADDTISLYDLNGKQYMSRRASGEIETVNTGRLQAGIYLLNVSNSRETQTLKMIVRH